MYLPAFAPAALRVALAALLLGSCAHGGGEPATAIVPLLETAPGGGPVNRDSGITVRTLADDLREPWGLDFLPDGSLLVTEKAGTLLRVDSAGTRRAHIIGVPPVADAGQGGLMDVVVHPAFADNHWIYLSYTVAEAGAYSTRVSRARLVDDELRELEVLFTASPWYRERRHFGSRLLLDDSHLYITVGDRGNRNRAQSLETHNGKVLRLTEGGGVPADNPFVGRAGARPEIWSYGHRNPQGIARHPLDGSIWVSEHGPQGGDEINVLVRGANYGWPVVTYGEEYGGGRIGEGTHREGMNQPLRYWTPSIGSSGIAFYTGDAYPAWGHSLLVAGLRQPRISRLALAGSGMGEETVLLGDLDLRVRDVQVGPDGLIYALAGGSRMLRLEPAAP